MKSQTLIFAVATVILGLGLFTAMSFTTYQRALAQVPAPPPAPRDVSCAATSAGFCCGEAGPAGPVLRCVNAAGEPMPWPNPFTRPNP